MIISAKQLKDRVNATLLPQIPYATILDKLHDVFMVNEQRQFVSQGSFMMGRKWEKLSDRYKTWKNKHYPGREIMVASGALMQAATVRTGAGHVKAIVGKTGTFGVSDSEIPYAKYHNDPSGARTKMPYRPFIRMTPAIKKQWQVAVGEFMTALIKSKMRRYDK